MEYKPEGYARGIDFGMDPDLMKVNAKLNPVGDKVVVKLDPIPEETEGGIALVQDSRMFDYLYGTVVAVGKGRYSLKTGVFIPNELKPGDRVMLGRYVGADLVFEGEKYKIMPEFQIDCAVAEE